MRCKDRNQNVSSWTIWTAIRVLNIRTIIWLTQKNKEVHSNVAVMTLQGMWMELNHWTTIEPPFIGDGVIYVKISLILFNLGLVSHFLYMFARPNEQIFFYYYKQKLYDFFFKFYTRRNTLVSAHKIGAHSEFKLKFTQIREKNYHYRIWVDWVYKRRHERPRTEHLSQC